MKIEEILDENVDSLTNDILSRYPEVTHLHISSSRIHPKAIRIDNIVIDKESRKSGIGSDVMRDIINYADSKDKILFLTPAQKDTHHGTTSRSRLIRFYKQFGFVENKGRHKNFEWPADAMYRLPQ